jgi:excinuclease UvrABC helicase subunit UvrB
MREAARRFDFKQAAAYRDRLRELRSRAAPGVAIDVQ